MPFYRYTPRFGPLQVTTPIPGAPTEASSAVGYLDDGAPRPEPRGYAVVDLETTGLSPQRDAILEIGLVLTDLEGRIEGGWSTLVNPGPGRAGMIEVGPQFIHGIRPQDVAPAPSFAQVADVLVHDVAGRVVVAHNARFDVSFLSQALERAGYLEAGARVPRLCTMEWSRHFITTPSRSLKACCEVTGVNLGHHHSALDDAEAAAGLLQHYMGVAADRGEALPWARTLMDAAAFHAWHWDEEQVPLQQARLLPRS